MSLQYASARKLLTLLGSFILSSLFASQLRPTEAFELDVFHEALHLQPLLLTKSPQLFLGRFEFQVTALLSSSFQADQFDLFPKPIGKLLNSHSSIRAFEAVLTQGRWKRDEWGAAPREFRPPGAVLIAATSGSSNTTRMDEATEAEAEEAWHFLTSTLTGSLCASFGGMDPKHQSAKSGSAPMDVPQSWVQPGLRLRVGSLPYEPVCTENLTPWLKLLPCGRHLGLATLMAPLAIAESPLISLSLAVTVHQSPARVELIASLDAVLELPKTQTGEAGLNAWLPRDEVFKSCPAASLSRVLMWTSTRPDATFLERTGGTLVFSAGGMGYVMAFPMQRFADPGSLNSDAARLLVPPPPKEPTSAPWQTPQPDDPNTRLLGGDDLAVLRDILSQEGRSERTRGRYLLRFTNRGRQRMVRFWDHLSFFVRPLWHTLRATLQLPGKPAVELIGMDAMLYLNLHFVPSDGGQAPTAVFLSVMLPQGATISVFLNVIKSFIQTNEFSYAAEKGFDIGSAAWVEIETEDSNLLVSTADWVHSLRPASELQEDGQARWRLRFTEGLIVLVPMPDFSMVFNVIALSATAATFFFGSVFRLTATGRLPHWAKVHMEKEAAEAAGLPSRSKAARLRRLLPLLVVALIAFGLETAEPAQLTQFLQLLRTQLPQVIGQPLADLLVKVKEYLDQFLGRDLNESPFAH